MKLSLRLVAVFVAFCCQLPMFGQNRLDITLQGPWILYVDSGFSGRSLLVAFAPGTQGRFAHKRPFFGAGNGFPIINPGTYCVGFDKNCALDRGKSSLSNDSYPTNMPRPLPVVRPAADWNWLEHRSNYGTYLIFPMPDSYSNDGTYKATYGKQFMVYDHTKEEEHSIGVQLHYDKGPAELELYQCAQGAAKPTDCKPAKGVLVGSVTNSGTLEVEMKAPATIADNACDYHVRSAYPQMLHLLDPDPNNISTAPKNMNLDKAFIDVPSDIDVNGKGIYVDDCYKCDEQNSNLSQCNQMIAMNQFVEGMPEMPAYEPTLDVAAELGKILEPLHQPGLNQELLKVNELTKLKDSLSGGVYPTFSQLELLQLLLSQSSVALSSYLEDQVAEARTNANTQKLMANANAAFSGLADALFREQRLNVYAATLDATKDGKDCRAPIMLAQ